MSNVIHNKVPPITDTMNNMPTMFSANNTQEGHRMSASNHSITAKKIEFPPMTHGMNTGHRANNSFSSAGAQMMGSKTFGR